MGNKVLEQKMELVGSDSINELREKSKFIIKKTMLCVTSNESTIGGKQHPGYYDTHFDGDSEKIDIPPARHQEFVNFDEQTDDENDALVVCPQLDLNGCQMNYAPYPGLNYDAEIFSIGSKDIVNVKRFGFDSGYRVLQINGISYDFSTGLYTLVLNDRNCYSAYSSEIYSDAMISNIKIEKSQLQVCRPGFFVVLMLNENKSDRKHVMEKQNII